MKKLLKNFMTGLTVGIPLAYLVGMSTIQNTIIFVVMVGILGVLAGLAAGKPGRDFRANYRPG